MSAEDKHRIRTRARTARQGLPPDERTLLSSAACTRLLELPIAFESPVVLAYAASPEELDPREALTELEKRGARIVLPRIAGPGALTLHRCRAGQLDPEPGSDTTDALEPGPFGIRQPCVAAERVSPDQIDLVIVPGVAFDPSGRRLGYGGGYYDRLLPRLPRAVLVGLAFDSQIVAQLPDEPHDVSMQVVITPSRTLRST